MHENEISEKEKNSAKNNTKILAKIFTETLKRSTLENLQTQEKMLQRNKTKRNLNKKFSLKVSYLFQTYPTLSNLPYFLQ